MCSEPTDSGNFFANNSEEVPQVDDRRYRAERVDDNSWRVIDQITGVVAASDGRDMAEMCEEDARDLANELNHCEEIGLPSPLL